MYELYVGFFLGFLNCSIISQQYFGIDCFFRIELEVCILIMFVVCWVYSFEEWSLIQGCFENIILKLEESCRNYFTIRRESYYLRFVS